MAIYTNKTAPLRREQFIASWREYAPEVTFAGMTLAEFEAGTLESIDVRKRMDEAQTKLAGMKLAREQADRTMTDLMILVAHGVRADPTYGEDSPFYRALGYVPKSERKSGLSRRPAQKTPPSADAA